VQPERQVRSKIMTTTYHEVYCAFNFPTSRRDFWMLGATEQ